MRKKNQTTYHKIKETAKIVLNTFKQCYITKTCNYTFKAPTSCRRQ